MDFLTQQFIASAKRIRDEIANVIGRLSSFGSDLKEIKEAAQSIDKTAKATQQAKAPQVEVRALLDIPGPIETKRDAYDDHQQRRDRWRLLVETFTLFAVVGYGYMTIRMWREMISARHQGQQAIKAAQDAAREAQNANLITKESLVAVQRAFVFPSPTNDIPGGPVTAKSQGIVVFIDWNNSGTTPAKWMTFHNIAIWFEDGMPSSFSFPEKWGPIQSHILSPTVIPPKGNIRTHNNIPLPVFTKWMNGGMHVYFYGWARYKDVFNGTPEHLTKFCYEMERVEPPRPISNQPGFSQVGAYLAQCPRNNCYDEQCRER